MSWQAVKAVYEVSEARPTDRLVLLTIAWHMDKRGPTRSRPRRHMPGRPGSPAARCRGP